MLEKIRRNFKVIFPLLVMLLLVGLVLSRVYQPEPEIPEPEVTILAKEANHNIGRAARVCGEVSSARFARKIKGKPTFLNLGRPHPDQFFTAVIWGDHRSKWNSPPEKKYKRQKICISGTIRRHENTPQIEVKFPRQIELQKEVKP